MKNKKKIGLIFLIVILLTIVLYYAYYFKMDSYEYIHWYFPFDYGRAYEKGAGLSKSHMTFHYINLQNIYRNKLCEYLNSKLSFGDLDEELKANGFNTKNEYNKHNGISDIHQYFKEKSTIDSDYVYLRNVIFLEHLSKEDIYAIKNRTFGKDMVERTYKLVIDKYEGEFDDHPVSYLNHNRPMRTMSYDIVLFYDYNFYDEKDKSRRRLLNKILAKYEQMFSEELNHPVKIINIVDHSQWKRRK